MSYGMENHYSCFILELPKTLKKNIDNYSRLGFLVSSTPLRQCVSFLIGVVKL